MATHTKTVSITDDDQKLLSNDLYNDMSDNAGIVVLLMCYPS